MRDTIKRQKLFFISLIGIVVVSLTMSVTYAYQTLIVTDTDERNVSVQVGNLKVDITKNATIDFKNMPVLPEYRTADYIEIELDNTKSTDNISYTVRLKDLEYTDNLLVDDNGNRNNVFKYAVVEVKDSTDNIKDYEETLIYEGDFSSLSTGNEHEDEFYFNLSEEIYDYIETGATKTIRIYIWLQETEDNQNYLFQSSFKGIVEIASVFSYDMLSNTIIRSAKLAASNNDGSRTQYDENNSFDGYPDEEKRLIKVTYDNDYSYIFRGEMVTDNYVNFANMCWKIVRINSDGSVKLILEDQYAECDDTTNNDKGNDGVIYTGAWDIPASDGTNLTMNGEESYRTGNFGYDNATYSGKAIASYLNPVTNSDRSMINAFKYFQNNNLSGYTSKLTTGNWCYNDTAYRDKGGTTIINKQEYYNGTVVGSFYYDAYVKGNSGLTLKCNGTILNEYSDNTLMLVGTLTADEIRYAGAHVGYNGSSNPYLINNYQWRNELSFSLLSLWQFQGYYDTVAIMSADSDSGDDYPVNSELSFRPAVVLKPGAGISGGTGIQRDPYVILND